MRTWNGLTNKVVDIVPADGSKFDKNKEYTVAVNNFMYGQTGAKGLWNKYGKMSSTARKIWKVRTAYNQRLIGGAEGGSFAPDSEVAGEQALSMALSALKLADADKAAVSAKLSAGLNGGDASKKWDAAQPISRAQAAVLVSRMLAEKAAQKK